MEGRKKLEELDKISKLIRYYSLAMSTEAGSGHPTSSLSATELMAGLFFGGAFRYRLDHPDDPNNDRIIFSKGHASPLFYSLWAVAGAVSEKELMTFRKFGSPIEGHPTVAFRYTEAATGSLGQGLSIGVGMALNAKYLDKLPYRTYVLLGDSEMAEGSQWESIEIAAYYKLNNLVGVLDVNRLGQRGETMYGWDVAAYARKIGAFGWETIVIDGHSYPEVLEAYEKACRSEKPVMVIAKTIKGKGVSFLEDKNGWHGVTLKKDEFDRALKELGEIDFSVRGEIARPEDLKPELVEPKPAGRITYPVDKPVATREAYGSALARIYPQFPTILSLDAEVSNSTGAEIFKKSHPDRFFEMFIAEQNMVGAAVGFARRGKIPFVSTFAAFLSRAFDQIRMSQYSDANIKFVGSHAGVSIGQDGPSQMGLEDIAMFRGIMNSVVLYPCDAVSAGRLVEEAAKHKGTVYIRTTRMATPIVYGVDESFAIGGSKVLRKSDSDVATVVAAGVTLHEALKAYEELKKQGIHIRVIDLYSVKPLDEATLRDAANSTNFIITVEDHYPAGGIGEAVRSALTPSTVPVYSLAVNKGPQSGPPQELLDYEEISQKAIISKIKEVMFGRKRQASSG
ncbi:MAG: transketolase [Syntrophobacteraceae bacterium]|jgi:transketolase